MKNKLFLTIVSILIFTFTVSGQTQTINKNLKVKGKVMGYSFEIPGGTSDDVLLGDGSTTSLAGIGGGSGGSTTIIDNLTSTSTIAALSANQGKILNDSKAGLNLPNIFSNSNTFNQDVKIKGEATYDNAAMSTISNIGNIATSVFGYTKNGTHGAYILNNVSGQSLYLTDNGNMQYSGFQGISDRMLITNSLGEVSTQPISTGGVTAEQLERIGNIGKYWITSIATSEILSESDINPTISPYRGTKMWRIHTSNDTITVDNTLSVGIPFVIEAGSTTDSVLVKAATGVDIYGQGNSLVQSGTSIDGFWFKKGNTVVGMKMGNNSYRFEGPWSVATISQTAPVTEYYTILNAAASGNNETNSITGIVRTDPTAGTWTSLASDSGTDNYMLRLVQNTKAGDYYDYLNTTGIPIGVPLIIEIDVAGINVTDGSAEFDLQSSRGWTANQFLVFDTNVRQTLSFTATATSSTPQITIYDSSIVAGQGWKIYEIRIRLAN